MSSEGEYGDVRLHAEMDPEAFVRVVNAARPCGVTIEAATRVDVAAPSLTSRVEAARYRVDLSRLGISAETARARVEEFLARTEVTLEKRVKKKRGVKIIRMDVRALVRELAVEERDGRVTLNTLIGRRSGNLGRPREVLVALFGLDPDAVLDAKTHKTESFVEFDGRLVSVGSGWAGGEPFDPWRAARPAEAAA
jgi:radical SAM-linked protein